MCWEGQCAERDLSVRGRKDKETGVRCIVRGYMSVRGRKDKETGVRCIVRGYMSRTVMAITINSS